MAPLIALIAGVGPGTGASLARKFASAYPVVLLARSPSNYEGVVKEINASGGKAVGISADVSDEESLQKAFEEVKKGVLFGGSGRGEGEGVGIAAAVFNLGGGFVKKPFLELSKEEFESGWRSNGFVYFLLFTFALYFSFLSLHPPPAPVSLSLSFPLLLSNTYLFPNSIKTDWEPFSFPVPFSPSSSPPPPHPQHQNTRPPSSSQAPQPPSEDPQTSPLSQRGNSLSGLWAKA